jgi:hypothetical protein
MNVATSPRRLLGRACLIAVSVATLVVALQPPPAFASGSLSTIVVTKTFPGFVLSTPGTDNGPLTAASVSSLFANESKVQQAQFVQLLNSGQLSGYARIWRSQPLVGSAVVLFAFHTDSNYSLSTLLGGLEKGIAAQVVLNHGSTFGVPGVADSKGYSVNVSENGTAVREFAVAFAKGNDAFLITLATTNYSLTKANAVTLAQRQWAQTPGAAVAPQSPPSVAVDLLWGVVAAFVVAMLSVLWLRQRTRRRVRDNPAVDVVRYALYKHVPKDQRKSVRKALVKSRLFEEDHLNNAALAWADRNLKAYWIILASFVAMDVTVFIVSQGHVYLVSILAIAMFIGALKLRMKRNRFIELRQRRVAELAAAVPVVNP